MEQMGLALADLQADGVDIAAAMRDIRGGSLGEMDCDGATVLVSLMGDSPLAEEIDARLRAAHAVRYIYLMHGPGETRRLGITAAQEERIREYQQCGGLVNMRELWRYLAHEFDGMDGEPAAPQKMLDRGLYYPGEAPYESFDEYWLAHVDLAKPTVGFLFLREDWLWGKTEFYDVLIRAIEAAGMNVLPLFTYWGPAQSGAPGMDESIREFFCLNGDMMPQVIINHHRMSIRMGRSRDLAFLEKLGVPVLQAYHTKKTYGEWRLSQAGLTPTEISSTVAMMECDGILHGAVASHRRTDEWGRNLREPWERGVNLLVRKAKRWALLWRKSNREKKIGIVLHNYPANNAHVGCAADLDSPTSLYRLLCEMDAAGYDVGGVPADAATLWAEVMAHVTNDRRYLSERTIKEACRIPGQTVAYYEKTLPPRVQKDLEAAWGAAPGEVFADGTDLLMPGFERGNVYIALQPPRGFGEDAAAIIHSPDLVPTHHYLAYYYFLRSVWGADALIHLGTHGSQEWLPGKQMGLSDECYPLITMDDMPNLYPYLTTIVGEGTQAKRRGSACLIGYLPAPSEPGGLYGDWEKAEPLLEEYYHFKMYQPEQVPEVLHDLTELVAQLGMADYFGEAAGREDEYVLAVHNFLHDLEQQQSHTGLHILGEAPSGAELAALVERLTRVPQGDVPALPVAVGRALGVDYDALLDNARKTPSEIAAMRKVEDRAHALVEALAATAWRGGTECLGAADLPVTEDLRAVLQLITEDIVPRCQGVADEMANLLLGLAGHYVPAAPGGSPSSGQLEALPTGRNFYGIDPAIMPTPTAWKLGVRLGDALLEQYVADEGRYPEQVGVIVWAGPNLRSHGQCLAEIMYLLGVKPVWRPESGKVAGLEILSPAELGRPRIDVTARISGLVRDCLPQAVAWLNRAVDAVADLDEPETLNYIRKHIREDSEELTAAGTDPAEALRTARYRVFGCPPGAYGAGVGGLLENRNWEDDDDLADVYVTWGGYAYDEKGLAHEQTGAFRRRLATLDVTVKNEDTRDVHLMSSDDFNAYHGGMVAAVRALGGKAPRSYVGDSSQRNHVQVRTLAEEFRRVLNAEALNPKFIHGMMKHGYKGASELAKYTALAYGWDATSRTMNDASYNRLAQAYLLDDEVREWLNSVNPWAVHEMAETLMEAQKRQLWNAPADILQALQDIYLETEGDLEEKSE